jgi:DNA replication ATP-dependent helicase Dna2
MDIEESIWAPRYGLKGFIDATVLVRLLGKGGQHAASDAAAGKLGLAALEFKSGKQHHSHRAQLGTYGLLLQSRYGIDPAGGLLWYSRSENMEFDSMNSRDVAGLFLLSEFRSLHAAFDIALPLNCYLYHSEHFRHCPDLHMLRRMSEGLV